MKNRVIRADDNLWGAVELAATKRGISVPEWVRETLREASKPKKCFHCGLDAVHEASGRITKATDQSFDDFLSLIKSGAQVADDYSSAEVTIYGCEEHGFIAELFLADTAHGCTGTILIDHPCSHPTGSYHLGGEYLTSPAYTQLSEAFSRVASRGNG